MSEQVQTNPARPGQKPLVRLCASGIMIALGTVMSMISIWKMPLGGRITPLSMLPICIIAIIYGTKWGLCTSFAYALVQLILDFASALSWGLSVPALVVCFFVDYLCAFTMLGFAGVFRKKGDFGYIAVDAMDSGSADAFADQVFAECFGKDGLVVDVRYNTGGRTADRLIDILCGNRHERTLYRGAEEEGYFMDRYGRPVIAGLPVVVLANERSASNAEEFAHAMQTLRRAKVVGRETAGDVIGTTDVFLFDYGVVRRPRVGTFLPDGTYMEGNGAKPDVEVDLTPADVAAGRDPQLAAALDVLSAEVSGRTQPPPLRYAPLDAKKEW